MLSRHVLVTLLAALLGAAAVARAQELEGGVQRAGEPSWGDHAHPERRRARQLRRQGLVKLLDAQESDPDSLGPPPEVLFEQALVRFERARRDLPDDPDLLYFTGLALAGWFRREPDGREERRTEEAVAAFEDLRRADPDYHADRVAFELAILHSRRGDHRAAVSEYRRALDASLLPAAPMPQAMTDRELSLARLFTPVPLATVHLNLAENTMMIGDLESAIASYRRASELAGNDSLGRVLSLWGLALALDRSGEHREALATARRAIQADPFAAPSPTDARLGVDRRAHGPMAVLHSRLVFFEPAYEVHAYDGVGWEALALEADAAASREELLRRARASWATYLTGGGNEGRYAEHATRAAERLDQDLARRGR
ncbi:tetratricopeptide repeat protein [Sandaracinus amylolyticus]|uniref:Tetratricopeptide repeat protein n=1 Tax=Sandaracinus amylolyticus TaxID=927083 RepID=A0A0F6W4W7_9BACT|nr:tetratricopeptide repeat protein [Sandaracinus amylolyticus]AKF07498.1 hypothetical protein DB32_004647 [Sandaracinus amylolyticus]